MVETWELEDSAQTGVVAIGNEDVEEAVTQILEGGAVCSMEASSLKMSSLAVICSGGGGGCGAGGPASVAGVVGRRLIRFRGVWITGSSSPPVPLGAVRFLFSLADPEVSGGVRYWCDGPAELLGRLSCSSWAGGQGCAAVRGGGLKPKPRCSVARSSSFPRSLNLVR